MDIWADYERLIRESGVEIDRPKGSAHPHFADIIYPLDYGYIRDTTGGDGEGIDVWIGAGGVGRVDGLIVTLDLFKRNSEAKVLCGCSPREMEMIREFLAVNGQAAMLVTRKTSS